MKGRVLVAGFTTRHVAQSAWKAGYEVYAVDHFCDEDLGWYTAGSRTFDDLASLPGIIGEVCRERKFDILVVTSGAENLATSLPLYGTPPDLVERYLDKLTTQHFLEGAGVPVPKMTGEGEYPCMIKPRRGAGGWRNQVICSADEKEAWEALFPNEPAICQELVEGVAASVSCIANGSHARAIATNEQILRGGGERAFGYSGSVTPCGSPLAGRMIALAERVAGLSGCLGSVGVDFVLGEKTWAIELNPRFQATLDTVEMATGCNIFSLHLDACRGRIPDATPQPRQVAARQILFADRDCVARESLSNLAPRVADIPKRGTEIEEGSAVVSTFGWGPTRASALEMLDKTITDVKKHICRW